jgi:RimJ/RimL family protein N-acetyltransferase
MDRSYAGLEVVGMTRAFPGYGALAGHAGPGYMTEALRPLLREAFTTLRLHPRDRARWAIRSDNRRSK